MSCNQSCTETGTPLVASALWMASPPRPANLDPPNREPPNREAPNREPPNREAPNREPPGFKPPEPPKNRGGRPRALGAIKQRELFKLLRQGHTRRDAAQAVKVALSTIRLETRRDVRFALELRHAEVEGQEFRCIFSKLFVPGRVKLEARPVISTPEFEREKEYLISKGVSRDWVSRMRLVGSEELLEDMEWIKKSCQQQERKGLSADLKRARNMLCGEEIVEQRFSPDGRQKQVVITRRRMPPSESELANRVASLEMAIDLPSEELERLLAQMEDWPAPEFEER